MELSGSTKEGTKVDAPDDFDILCFLDNFESLCQIEEVPDTEFIHCRRNRSIESHLYNDFFDDDEYLIGNRMSRVFYAHIKESLGNPSVLESAPGLTGDDYNEISSAADLPDILCLRFCYSDANHKNCQSVVILYLLFAKSDGGLHLQNQKVA